MKCSVNIVILGKSGAGKSSFCNYFFDLPLHFAAGSGKPVTGWAQNFQSHEFEMKGFSLKIFDSVGIEPDNWLEWKNRLDTFLSSHNVSDDPGEWIHGFFYVLNANSARIEDVEIDLIKKLSLQAAPVQIILTNCDAAGEEKASTLVALVAGKFPNLSVHRVCSVDVRKRGGLSTAAYGRDEVLKTYLQQSEKFLLRHLAVRSCEKVGRVMGDAGRQLVTRIRASNLSVLNISEFDLDSMFSLPDFEQQFEDFNIFKDYLAEFGFDGDQWDEFPRKLEQAINERMDAFGTESRAHFDQLGQQLEYGSLWEKVSAAAKMGKTAILLKSMIADTIERGFYAGLEEVAKIKAEYVSKIEFADRVEMVLSRRIFPLW